MEGLLFFSFQKHEEHVSQNILEFNRNTNEYRAKNSCGSRPAATEWSFFSATSVTCTARVLCVCACVCSLWEGLLRSLCSDARLHGKVGGVGICVEQGPAFAPQQNTTHYPQHGRHPWPPSPLSTTRPRPSSPLSANRLRPSGPWWSSCYSFLHLIRKKVCWAEQ